MRPEEPALDLERELEDLKRKKEELFERFDSPAVAFGVLAGSLVVAFGLQEALVFVGGIHPLLGLAFSAAILVVAYWILCLARRDNLLALTRSTCVGSLATGLFGAIVVSGWVSLALHNSGIALYSVETEASIESFTRLYFYTLADLVPALAIVDTLSLSSPVKAQDVLAGWPILAFRIFVVWFVLRTFTEWRKKRREENKAKPADSLLFLAVFLLMVALLTSNLR